MVNGLSSGAFTFTAVSVRSSFPSADIILNDATYSQRISGVGLNPDAINSSYFNNYVTPIQRRGTYNEYVMDVCPKLPVSECQPSDWIVDAPGGVLRANNPDFIGISKTNIGSGTTAISPSPQYRGFPRRVAFKRNSSYNLLDSSGSVITFGSSAQPVPLRINGSI